MELDVIPAYEQFEILVNIADQHRLQAAINVMNGIKETTNL